MKETGVYIEDHQETGVYIEDHDEVSVEETGVYIEDHDEVRVEEIGRLAAPVAKEAGSPAASVSVEEEQHVTSHRHGEWSLLTPHTLWDRITVLCAEHLFHC